MDLGIKGRSAIVCAASSGIGRACAMALAVEGVNVVINGRTPETLNAVADEIRAAAPDVAVKTVAGSVTDPGVRAALADAFPAIDILINNAGGPPPGDFRDWDRDTWIAAIDQNMLSAIELIRLTGGRDGRARLRADRQYHLLRRPRADPGHRPVQRDTRRADQFRAGTGAAIFGQGGTINNILPGPFDTNRLRKSGEITNHLTGNPVAGRVGDPAEMGAMCAFLCSAHAGYFTGQNILMDGGLYPGSF